MAAINRFIPLFSSQSGAVPTASQMEDGELAINTADGRLFTKQGNQIIMLAGHIQVSSSWAATASYVPNLYPAGAIPIMSGGGVVVNNPVALNFLGSGVSVTNNANTASITIVSGAANWTNLVNIPVGLVSSSTQYSTGSYTGSFTGSLLGSGTYALSASAATSITFTPPTASYSVTSSFARSASYAGTDWNVVNNKPTVFSSSAQLPAGIVSSSVQLPTGLVSSSVQINTGSFTGSFTGSLLGSSSYALSSSWAARSVSASYAGTDWNAVNNKPTVFSSSAQLSVGVVSSSAQYSTGSYTGSFTGSLLGSASFANTSWGNVNNKPTVVSSSAQINSGSFTGSFTGSLLGSASYALTSSYAMNGGSGGVSSSYAVTSSYATLAQNVLGSITSASYALTASYAVAFSGSITNAVSSSWSAYAVTASYFSASADFPNGLVVTGSVTASAYTGSGVGIIGVISSSYSLTASYAMNGGSGGVSSSYATTSSFASKAALATTATTATTASYVTGTISFPNGLVVTGSVTASAYTGSFTGSLLGSSSYALSASWAPTSAGGDFNTLINKPTLVSSSVQINTGSFTGSFVGSHTGSLLGTSSYATTASYAVAFSGSMTNAISASYSSYAVTASYFSGTMDFPNGLNVTGSVTASIGYTGSFTGSLRGSASYALTSSYAMNGGSGGVSSSYAVTSSYASLAQNVLGAISSASWAAYAVTASYISGGLDLSSGLIVTGSVTASVGYTGSFTGSLRGSSSYALTASYAMNGGSGGVSSSYATTSSYATLAQNVLGSITSASYALTASFATTAITASYFSGTVDFTNGMTVTGSTISTQGFTGSLSGTAALATSSSYALTASYAMAYSGSITNAISASYALTALTASYVSGGINFPSGLTVTGTLTATTFVGTGSGIVGVVSSSYAVTSSYAMNGGSGGVSSSYAITSSFASTARSASFATTSITASYFSTSVNFPAGLDVTGTLVATTGVTILRSGSLSLEATVTNNPIGILALTGTLPFTKLHNTSSNNTTLQIPSGTVTGSVFELVYSNMNSSTRNIMFPNVRIKDSIATAATWSVANSASVFFQFRYLPNFSASTTAMYWMPMFTQSIS